MFAKKHHKTYGNYASAPLLSWDIFMEGYWKKIALASDRQELKKIAGSNDWQQQWNFDTILLQEGRVIIVTDPLLHIVFAIYYIIIDKKYFYTIFNLQIPIYTQVP